MVEDHPLALLKLPTEVQAAILKAALVLTGAYLTFDCGGRSFDKIRRKGEGNSGQILRKMQKTWSWPHYSQQCSQ